MAKQRPLTDPVYLFREMLKMKRLRMNPGARKRSRTPRVRVRWLYPAAVEREYQKYLKKIMNVYVTEVKEFVRPRIERWAAEQKADRAGIRVDEFDNEFKLFLDNMDDIQVRMFARVGDGYKGFSQAAIRADIGKYGERVEEFNFQQWEKTSTAMLGDAFVVSEPWLGAAVSQWEQLNFTLIKSLTGEYIKDVNRIVSDGVTAGNTWNKIWGDIQDKNTGLSESRTRLIARDQVGKLNGQITKKRNESAGIEMYEWLTSGDSRVRDSHIPLDGKICQWDDGSIYADSIEAAIAGEWNSRSAIGAFEGMPGEDFQCRCTSAPVFADMVDEIDQEISEEGF